MRCLQRALAGATLVLVPGTAALAADADATAAEQDAAQVIVVTGSREEYGVKSTITGTKTVTALRNIPQAISIVSEAQIEDQSLRSVADLLMFVPGATPGTGEANRDQLTLRGNNTTADFFVDGLRDDAQYFRDFYNLDRVEVLKGPNAMIFGRGGGGGVINRVTKRAGLLDDRQFIISHDSEGGTRLTTDDNVRLAGALGLRVNGVWEHGDSFRDFTKIKRYGINPTLGWQPGSDTRVDLSYEYFHDRRTTDRGIPSLGRRPLEGFDAGFFGDPANSVSDADVQIATLGVEQKFGDNLLLRHRSQFADYDKFYANLFPNSAVSATGTVAIGAYNSRNDRRNLISQTDLVWDGSLAGIDQTWLFGFEVGRQTSRNQRLSGRFLDANGSSVTLANPTVERRIEFFRAASDADNRTRATVAAAYAQTQLKPAEWIELVAGLRFDRFRLSVDDERTNVPTFARTDQLVSPRLGLVVKPNKNLSFYTSYSRSYLPQSGDQFGGLTQTSAALKPEQFDNVEAGAKWELLDGLLATAAVYQLDRRNTQAPNPIVGLPNLLTGATRTRGLELGVERSVAARLQVSAGYALQDSEIRRTTSAAPAGRKVPLVPRHSFSLWTKYQANKAFGAGLGLLARSKSFASLSNTATVLPGYARLDGALYYKLMPGIEAQLNVENLTDRDYFPTAHNDNNIAPGAPRNARLSLKAEF
ncbi:TonB-dependent receptor [Sphingomonas glaciei]|uniref:TonB-dependent siderophore receptor n=1 Tax=Sphingomonas glaciei TaxID=2938948 RepID=A0ABY5MT24_9SPHN|nr:TonB-dependent siderophore receptor [Sphingomonas glaciei]UUR07663.1 TonB-dependent siderophore receptor [Sphingomonas glaciei]